MNEPPKPPRKPTVAEIAAMKERERQATPPQAQDQPAPLDAGTPGRCAAVIDYYRHAEAPEADGTTTLGDMLDAIRGGEYAAQVAAIRKAATDGDKAGAATLKKKLPAVSLSGTVDGKRAKAAQEGRFTHAGLLQIDLDRGDNPDLDLADLRERLKADPHTVAFFESPSGGLKVVAAILPEVDAHRASFTAAEAYFLDTYGATIDKACKDPVRLCFVSHDPGAWMREGEAAPILPAEEPEAAAPAPTPAPAPRQEHGLTINGTGGTNGSHYEHTPESVRSMLAVIPPRPPYDQWLRIASAVWDAIGETEGTAALQAWSPEENPGEYAAKYQHRLTEIHVATLTRLAKEHGWKPARARQTTRHTAPAKTDGTAFPPEAIFYDAPGGSYLVDTGIAYFRWSRKTPVVNGVLRHLTGKGFELEEKQLLQMARALVADRELDGAVQWAGAIAGHRRGLEQDHDGRPILITTEAALPEPESGDAPTVAGIIGQAFPGHNERQVFIGWLATRYRAVAAGIHTPAPMLCIAGEVNSGKSLLAWIVGQVLGGRVANPHAAWTGGTLWNDNLVGAELLLIDDCVGNTDIRSRRNFAAAFKEAVYPAVIELRKRNTSSISVRPVWAVMLCCNDTPEALQVIPPIDADMSDKVILLRCGRVSPSVDTSTPEGRAELQSVIRAELPALAHFLSNHTVPEELRDTRSGIKAWRDPELAEALEANSPARRLEEILCAAIEAGGDTWRDLPAELTAAEIESRLSCQGSPVREQARHLFTWHGACGSALSRLAKIGSARVESATPDRHRKIHRYLIRP